MFSRRYLTLFTSRVSEVPDSIYPQVLGLYLETLLCTENAPYIKEKRGCSPHAELRLADNGLPKMATLLGVYIARCRVTWKLPHPALMGQMPPG